MIPENKIWRTKTKLKKKTNWSIKQSDHLCIASMIQLILWHHFLLLSTQSSFRGLFNPEDRRGHDRDLPPTISCFKGSTERFELGFKELQLIWDQLGGCSRGADTGKARRHFRWPLTAGWSGMCGRSRHALFCSHRESTHRSSHVTSLFWYQSAAF